MNLIVESLLECQSLETLALPVSPATSPATSGIVQLVEKNASSLTTVFVPAGDEGLPSVLLALEKCTDLHELQIGSQELTNAAAAQVVNLLGRQNQLTYFGLSGSVDDDGFSPIGEALGAIAETLDCLAIYRTAVSPTMICETLSPLTKLSSLRLYGVQVGDDGLRELVRHQALPRRVILVDVGITPHSIPVIATRLQDAPATARFMVVFKRSVTLSGNQDRDDVLPKALPPWKLVRESYGAPVYTFGLQITEKIDFSLGEKSQQFSVYI